MNQATNANEVQTDKAIPEFLDRRDGQPIAIVQKKEDLVAVPVSEAAPQDEAM